MMVCRRRWYVWAMVAVLAGGALNTSWAAAAGAAAAWENLTGRDLVRARSDELAKAPAGVVDRNNWAKEVAREFSSVEAGINSGKAEVRLNAAILMAELKTLSSDTVLMEMLKHTDPAVRFWGARGLAGIASPVRAALVAGPVVTALQTAISKETSGIVAQEIIKSLVAYGDPAAILQGLKHITRQLAESKQEMGMLQAATEGLNAIESWIRGTGAARATAAEKLEGASVAAELASYTAQRQVLLELELKETGGSLTAEHLATSKTVADAAARVAGAATGKNYGTIKGATSAELTLDTGIIFGGPTGPGTLQADLAGVRVPGEVKKGP